jgi:type II secretory pathway component PulF
VASLVVFGLVMLVFGWAATPAASYAAALLVVGTVPLILRMIRITRRRRGQQIITYLEQAVRLNLPLTRMIDAASHSERGPLADRLMRVSRHLQAGNSIGGALEAAVPELSVADVSMIDAAERVGRLPHTLHRMTNRERHMINPDPTAAALARAYPLLMIVLIASVLSMIMVYVIPKFETIFADFGTKLPPMTQTVIDFSRFIGPLFAIIAAALLLGWLLMALWHVVHPRSARWNPLHRLRDRLLWSMPLSHGVARDRGLAEALDLMADAVRAGHPFERAAEEASQLRVNEVLRERLEGWTLLLREGMSLRESARQAQLPEVIAQMLTPARGGEQAADVLEFLARYYDARFSRTRLLLQAAMTPAVVLFFAAIVACVAMALIMPLTTLIQNISASSSTWRL